MRISHVFSLVMLISISSTYPMLKRSSQKIRGATRSLPRRFAEKPLLLARGIAQSPKLREDWLRLIGETLFKSHGYSEDEVRSRYLAGLYNDAIRNGGISYSCANSFIAFDEQIELKGLKYVKESKKKIFDDARGIAADSVFFGVVTTASGAPLLGLGYLLGSAGLDGHTALGILGMLPALGGVAIEAKGSLLLLRAIRQFSSIRRGGPRDLIPVLKAKLEKLDKLD